MNDPKIIDKVVIEIHYADGTSHEYIVGSPPRADISMKQKVGPEYIHDYGYSKLTLPEIRYDLTLLVEDFYLITCKVVEPKEGK